MNDADICYLKIICVALTVLFGIETIMKFRAWKGENAPTSTVLETGGSSQSGRVYARELREPHQGFGGEVSELHRHQGLENP